MKFLPDLTKFAKRTSSTPKDNIHSLELVLTVVVFVLIGRFLDSKFDTGYTFTVIGTLVGACGAFASAYFRYMEISKKQDADKAYTRKTTKKVIETQAEVKDGLVIPQGYGQDD